MKLSVKYSEALNAALKTGNTNQLKTFSKEVDEQIARMKGGLKSDKPGLPAATTATQHPPASTRPGRRRAIRGMGRTFRRGRIWHIAFYHRGEEIRESPESESEAAARKLLKRRLAEIQTGRFIIDEEKVTFENLAEGLLTDYKLNGRRSLESAALNNIRHLRAFFGFDRAIDISSDRLKTYQLRRREQGASVATVNRECATLRRMFSIAVEAGKLSRCPSSTCLTARELDRGSSIMGTFSVC